jgi:hypothetical protein
MRQVKREVLCASWTSGSLKNAIPPLRTFGTAD